MSQQVDILSARLPCGAIVEELVDQVAARRADRRGEHQLHCPFCSSALDELDARWQPIDRLRSRRPRAPSWLVAAVMSRIRTGRDRPAALARTARGSTRVPPSVLGRLAGLVVEDVPGVASVTNSDVSLLGTEERGHYRARISVGVVAHYGLQLEALAGTIRAALYARLPMQAGVAVASVDVTVVDAVLPG